MTTPDGFTTAEDYAELREAIDRAGLPTTVMPTRRGDWRLVVAEKRGKGVLHGYSFCISFRHGQRRVYTWTPHFYRAPDDVDLVEFALRRSRRGAAQVTTFRMRSSNASGSSASTTSSTRETSRQSPTTRWNDLATR